MSKGDRRNDGGQNNCYIICKIVFYEPDVIVDITEVWEQRLESIKAFKTQFHNPEIAEEETYISSPAFLESIIARARLLGKRIGVQFAEGFVSKKNIGIDNLDALILRET